MKKVKVASLFASLKIGGGVEKVQANLSLWLDALGYEFIHILSDDLEPRNKYAGKIISLKSKFIKGFWIEKIIKLFSDARKVKNIVNKENIDILIGQGDYFYMLSGLAKLFGYKWKTVAVVHTTIWIRPQFIIRILRFFLSLHDKIVLISQEELATFRQKYQFPEEKLALIYNTIDTKNIDSLAKEEVSEVDFSPFTFINIGRLSYQKGQDRLLEAFDQVYAKNSNIQLIILWDGELRGKLENKAKTLDSKKAIHFLGNQKNIYRFLSRSDCFVLSSRFEGFPMVLIEAICMGIPIISTNCSTWPTELFIEKAKKMQWRGILKTEIWYLVDQKRASINLAKASTDILNSNKISYNTEKYRKKFSSENNLYSWENLIQSVLS